MSVTPNRHLPLMESSQAQPEVVYNAAMVILDDTTSGGGGSPLQVELQGSSPGVENVTKIIFDGPAASVAAGGNPGEVVVTIDTVSGGGGGGGSATFLNANITPDTHPNSPAALDDEFEGSTLDGKWTQQNWNSSTAVPFGGYLQFGSANSGVDNPAQLVQSIPAPTLAWDFRCKIPTTTQAGAESRAGIFVGDFSTGKGYLLGHYITGGSANNLYISRQNAWGGSGVTNVVAQSNQGGSIIAYGLYPAVWFRISFDGTSLSFWKSIDGAAFVQITTPIAYSTFLGTQATGIGIYEANGTASNGVGTFDWFRDYTAGYTPASSGQAVPTYGASTVALLPAIPVQGARAFVTDATATTFLSTVAGGGSDKVPVVYDGTNWVIG